MPCGGGSHSLGLRPSCLGHVSAWKRDDSGPSVTERRGRQDQGNEWMGVECPSLEEAGGQVGNLDMAGLREMEVGDRLLKVKSGLAGADGEMLKLERRVPSALLGEGVVGFEGARSDLLPGSHHRRERVTLVCWCGGIE